MPTKPKVDSKTITKAKTEEEIRDFIKDCKNCHDPETVLKEFGESLTRSNNQDYLMMTMNGFKAVTLHEFTNGMLMTEVIPDKYRTFAIDMLRQLQLDYSCQTVGEKALAELATVNFIRILDIQEKMMESLDTQKAMSHRHNSCQNNLNIGHVNALNACERTMVELRLLNFLSKELDRAQRHYLMAIHTLIVMKQPLMQVNIKTDTTVIGQNQLVQTNGHAKFNNPI